MLAGLGMLGAKRQNQLNPYLVMSNQAFNKLAGKKDSEARRRLIDAQINQLEDPAYKPTSLEQNLAASGLTPGTPAYQDAMMKYLMRPIAPQINNIPSLPAGYRYTFGDNNQITGMEMIPGGPAEQQSQQQALENQLKKEEIAREEEAATRELQEAEEKKEARDRETMASIDNTLRNIREAEDMSGFLSTGIAGKLTDWIPGTPAYNLAQKVITVKSNIGFDKLQRMRELSPTGGALGQVAVQELNALQNNIDALEPGMGEPAFDKALNEIEMNYTRVKATIDLADEDIDAAAFGKMTDQGLEVFNSQGELIGYYE